MSTGAAHHHLLLLPPTMSPSKMMTSLRLGEDGAIEIIDQLLLP